MIFITLQDFRFHIWQISIKPNYGKKTVLKKFFFSIALINELIGLVSNHELKIREMYMISHVNVKNKL